MKYQPIEMNPDELYAIARKVMMEKTQSLLEQVREGMRKAAEEGKLKYKITMRESTTTERTRNNMEFVLSIIEEDGFVVEYDNDKYQRYTYLVYWKKNEIALLRDEIAQLKAENAALRLLPGAPEYLAAEEHYKSLQKKE